MAPAQTEQAFGRGVEPILESGRAEWPVQAYVLHKRGPGGRTPSIHIAADPADRRFLVREVSHLATLGELGNCQ